MQKKFQVSSSSFEQLVQKYNGQYLYHFVDKTPFIKEVLENPGRVLLLTRPRRFGKSTNLDMLHCFLDIQRKETNPLLFKGLKIENMKLAYGEPCMDYYGRYPVIALNFKTLRGKNYAELWPMFKNMVESLYREHRYLFGSEGQLTSLEKDEQKIFEAILQRKADNDDYKISLKKLIGYLKHHYRREVYVLIDEYDVPFQQALHDRLQSQYETSESYFDDLKTLMGTFLGPALKDNPDLAACVMTGIVRIAGAGIFSELNNIDTWTVTDTRFTEYFGFTEEELKVLLEQTGQTEKAKEFSTWYNGYQFGNTVIYNPFSVIKCLDRREFNSYWLDTSDNQLIKDSLLFPKEIYRKEINEAVAIWVSGNSVQKNLSKDLTFNTHLNTLEHLWILLISAGYLNITDHQTQENEEMLCTLAIPNKEVLSIYRKTFTEWLSTLGVQSDSPLIHLLLTGQVEAFCEALKKFFQETIGYRDTRTAAVQVPGDEKYESYYHGFMVGLLGLSLRYYKASLKSNRESGYGYYDLVLEPKFNASFPYQQGIIFEFKRAPEKEEPEKSAQKALEQIKEKQYATDLIDRGVQNIVLIGMAFQGKNIATAYEKWVIDNQNHKLVTLGKVPSSPNSLFIKK